MLIILALSIRNCKYGFDVKWCVRSTDPDGLVDNETRGSGNFTLDGAQTTATNPRSATDLNSFVTFQFK